MELTDLEIFVNEKDNLVCPWCGKDHLTVTALGHIYGKDKYEVRCPRCCRFMYLNKGNLMHEWAGYCLDVITNHMKYPPEMAATLMDEIVGCDPVSLIYVMKKYEHILEAGTVNKKPKDAVKILVKDEVDMVNHPSHYETGKYECIEVMVEAIGAAKVMDFCLCNAFKYLYRCGRKNGVEDVKKARWYLNKYLELWEDFGDEDN